MNKFCKVTALALTLHAATAASAAVMFGAPDCGQWIATNRGSDRVWLLGYLSAKNGDWTHETKKDVLEQLNSADQIVLWMDNYCKANPLKNVATGAEILFLELATTAMQSRRSRTP